MSENPIGYPSNRRVAASLGKGPVIGALVGAVLGFANLIYVLLVVSGDEAADGFFYGWFFLGLPTSGLLETILNYIDPIFLKISTVTHLGLLFATVLLNWTILGFVIEKLAKLWRRKRKNA